MIDRGLAGIRTAVLALMFSAGLAHGQSLTTGSLSGLVSDVEGVPVPGATVGLLDETTGVTRSTVASRAGRYEFLLLPPGEYAVRVEQLGYRPTVVTGVPVRPGRSVRADAALLAAAPPVDAVETVRWTGTAPSGTTGGQWFSALQLSGLPERGREAGSLARLSTVSSPELEIEGLPSRMTGLVVDGQALAVARNSIVGMSPLRSAGAPLSSVAAAELVTGAADVEWSGYAGGFLNLHTRRASRTHEVRTFGNWSAGTGGESAGAVSANTLEGGVLLSGPLVADTAGYLIGVEHWRLATPVGGSLAPAAVLEGIGEIARDSFGVALGAIGAGRVQRSEVVTGFGRMDWQLADDHGVSVRASFAAVPAGSLDDPRMLRPAGIGSEFDGRDISVGAQLVSRLGDRVVQELRAGYETSRAEYASPLAQRAGEGGDFDLSSTLIVSGGLALGSDPDVPGLFSRDAIRVQNALHGQLGDHRLKVGLSGEFASYEHRSSQGRAGEFVFAGPREFERGEGYFMQTTGPVRSADFRVSRFGVFAQDTWTPLTGLELLVGLRYDIERLPTDDVTPNEEWERRSGMRRDVFDAAGGRLSPRLAFTWDLQQSWTLRGSAGIYRGSVDPAVLAEVLVNDGSLEVRRGLGELGGWPDAPDATSAPVQGNKLALMAPALEAPRTARGTLTASRLLGSGTTARLGMSYRRTEYLPRLADLNLRQAPLATDQHGRPVYGRLRQQGSLIAVENGSNRRFTGFDVVTAINADGWSEYLGGTITLERRAGDRFEMFGSYTYSRTEDNWLSARGGSTVAGFSPFPEGLDGGEWAVGVSDLDVPHRAVLGAELRLPALAGVSIAGVYRLQSGAPFTPGFRDGVDINGDGSIRNDPAYVDRAVAGMDEVLGAWPCLQAQVGRFAARNSCRGPAVHSLDLRLGIGLFRVREMPAELLLDGLNLIASEYGLSDRAVYLIDEAGELVWDESAGTVRTPLVANPGFGSSLVSYTAPRVLRIGLRLSF